MGAFNKLADRILTMCRNAIRRGNHDAISSNLLEFGSCEQLEDRQLLAGNVMAVLTANGSLRLTGDSADNHVIMGDLDNAPTPSIRVKGLSGTTINGQAEFVIEGTNTIQRDLIVNLKSGDDLFEISDEQNTVLTNVKGALRVNLGSGDDLFGANLNNVAEQGKLSRISTGSGDDIVHLTISDADGRLQILTGGGDDWVSLGRETGSRETFSERVNVVLGGNNDQLIVRNYAIDDSLSVVAGAGADRVYIGDAEIQHVDFKMGGGSDVVFVQENSTLIGTGRYAGAGGEDWLYVDPLASFQLTTLQVEQLRSSSAGTVQFILRGRAFHSLYVDAGGMEAMLLI